MGIVQRRINGRALYEAMKVNGVEHIRGEWFTFDADGKPVAGCAMGLMAINLKVKVNDSINAGANLYEQLRHLPVAEDNRWYEAPDEGATYGFFTDGTPVPYPNVADSIINWNDRDRYVYKTIVDSWDNSQRQVEVREYVLSTWEEVHQMVHDVLEPYFATEFVVDEWEWDANDFNNFGYVPTEPPEYAYEY